MYVEPLTKLPVEKPQDPNSNEKEDSKDSPSKIETISIIDEEKKSSTSQLENNISDK